MTDNIIHTNYINPIDRILRSREIEQRGLPMQDYKAFTLSEGRAQFSFSIKRLDGALDGFMYHNIDNVALNTLRGIDYLSFDHRGKAVTLSGQNLAPLFHALMGHTLMEVHEHEGSVVEDDEPCVKRIEITILQKKEPFL